MTLIDDIKRDREAGTPGPWETYSKDSGIRHHTDPPFGHHDYIAVIVAANQRPFSDARRIARVPQMEAALLAAEELAKATEWAADNLRGISANQRDALDALREALGAGE